jgi:hypothetical protein
VLDLEELREGRRKDEQQLPRQQQNKEEHDEVAKLKGEDDGSKSPSVAAVPALPERIQKPEGDSSPDQCRKEEGAAGGGGGNNIHEVTTSNAQEQEQHDNQENDRSKSPAA